MTIKSRSNITYPTVVTVKFIEAKDDKPARMRVYSHFFPKGITVQYPERNLIKNDSRYEAARYAAIIMSDRMTDVAGVNLYYTWDVVDVHDAYNGDRVVLMSQRQKFGGYDKTRLSGEFPLFTKNNATLCRSPRYVGREHQWQCGCDDPRACPGVKRAIRTY